MASHQSGGAPAVPRHVCICVGKKNAEETMLMWRWLQGYFLQPNDRVTVLHSIPSNATSAPWAGRLLREENLFIFVLQ